MAFVWCEIHYTIQYISIWLIVYKVILTGFLFFFFFFFVVVVVVEEGIDSQSCQPLCFSRNYSVFPWILLFFPSKLWHYVFSSWNMFFLIIFCLLKRVWIVRAANHYVFSWNYSVFPWILPFFSSKLWQYVFSSWNMFFSIVFFTYRTSNNCPKMLIWSQIQQKTKVKTYLKRKIFSKRMKRW